MRALSKAKFIGLLFFLPVAILACNNQNRESRPLITPGTNNEERVRPAIKGGTSAAYFTYQNALEVPDTLKSVRSPVAGLSQVHESYENPDGLMAMREHNNIPIEPGDTIRFKQGGLHIMLMQLNRDLNEGDTVTIELELVRSGRHTVQLPVRGESP